MDRFTYASWIVLSSPHHPLIEAGIRAKVLERLGSFVDQGRTPLHSLNQRLYQAPA